MAKRGPKTQAGKAIVALNAVQHGARSQTLIIPGIERAEDFDALYDGLVEDVQPVGEFERNLVELAAVSLWRLRRIHRYEVQSISVSLERVDDDLFRQRVSGLKPRSLDEAETNLRVAEDALALLQRLPAMSDDEPLRQPAVSEIIRWFAVNDEELLHFSLPGLPNVAEHEEYPNWTAGELRAIGAGVAERLDEPLDEVLEDTIVCLRDDIEVRRRAVIDVIERLDRMRRERVLPENDRLRNLARYEAHINRQFYNAIHELEAAQSRRRGEVTPLARVELHGLTGT
jgi:hypothetical protein